MKFPITDAASKRVRETYQRARRRNKPENKAKNTAKNRQNAAKRKAKRHAANPALGAATSINDDATGTDAVDPASDVFDPDTDEIATDLMHIAAIDAMDSSVAMAASSDPIGPAVNTAAGTFSNTTAGNTTAGSSAEAPGSSALVLSGRRRKKQAARFEAGYIDYSPPLNPLSGYSFPQSQRPFGPSLPPPAPLVAEPPPRPPPSFIDLIDSPGGKGTPGQGRLLSSSQSSIVCPRASADVSRASAPVRGSAAVSRLGASHLPTELATPSHVPPFNLGSLSLSRSASRSAAPSRIGSGFTPLIETEMTSEETLFAMAAIMQADAQAQAQAQAAAQAQAELEAQRAEAQRAEAERAAQHQAALDSLVAEVRALQGTVSKSTATVTAAVGESTATVTAAVGESTATVTAAVGESTATVTAAISTADTNAERRHQETAKALGVFNTSVSALAGATQEAFTTLAAQQGATHNALTTLAGATQNALTALAAPMTTLASQQEAHQEALTALARPISSLAAQQGALADQVGGLADSVSVLQQAGQAQRQQQVLSGVACAFVAAAGLAAPPLGQVSCATANSPRPRKRSSDVHAVL